MNGTLQKHLFRYRSYTPIPFLIVTLIFARPTKEGIFGGLVLIATGELVRIWAVSVLGEKARSTKVLAAERLVTVGPFGYVRNPMYLGNLLIYGGMGIMSMAWFPWLLLGAICWFSFQYRTIVRYEEGFLADRFGDEYARYKETVRRFLPRLEPIASGTQRRTRVEAKAGLLLEKRTVQAIGGITLVFLAIYLAQS
jgi:protein-S-isoprenylcysteine O-methyltransferase Ste14